MKGIGRIIYPANREAAQWVQELRDTYEQFEGGKSRASPNLPSLLFEEMTMQEHLSTDSGCGDKPLRQMGTR